MLAASLAWGYISYPYFDLAFQLPHSGSGKAMLVMDYLNSVGISISKERFIGFWMIVRSLKTILLSLFYTFGGAYMIYCWYHDRVDVRCS